MPSVLARLSGAARGKSRSVLKTGISHAILKRDVGKPVRISHPETASLVGAAKAVEVSYCYILGTIELYSSRSSSINAKSTLGILYCRHWITYHVPFSIGKSPTGGV